MHSLHTVHLHEHNHTSLLLLLKPAHHINCGFLAYGDLLLFATRDDNKKEIPARKAARVYVMCQSLEKQQLCCPATILLQTATGYTAFHHCHICCFHS